MKIITSFSFALGIMLTAVHPVFAGADANVNACIYMEVAPVEPIVFKFNAGNKTVDRCMHEVGSNASVEVKGAGVTCTPVGYIKRKSSSTKGDFCATTSPRWFLGYSGSGTSFSGSVQVKLSNPIGKQNSASISEKTNKTSVCGSDNLCSLDYIQWSRHTKGPIYLIFNPNTPVQK